MNSESSVVQVHQLSPIANLSTDAFVAHVIPHLVTPPRQRRHWETWKEQEVKRQRKRDAPAAGVTARPAW